MKDFEFCAFCHFVLDLLSYISILSCNLQSNKLILPTAVSALQSCIVLLDALTGRPKPGGFLSAFLTFVASQSGANEVKFQGNTLCGIREIELEGLNLDGMPLSFRRRVRNAVQLITDGMKERYHALIGDGAEEGAAKAVKCFTIFNHDTWPEAAIDRVDYGDGQIEFLTEWFKVVIERYFTSFCSSYVFWFLNSASIELFLLVLHVFV